MTCDADIARHAVVVIAQGWLPKRIRAYFGYASITTTLDGHFKDREERRTLWRGSQDPRETGLDEEPNGLANFAQLGELYAAFGERLARLDAHPIHQPQHERNRHLGKWRISAIYSRTEQCLRYELRRCYVRFAPD